MQSKFHSRGMQCASAPHLVLFVVASVVHSFLLVVIVVVESPVSCPVSCTCIRNVVAVVAILPVVVTTQPTTPNYSYN